MSTNNKDWTGNSNSIYKTLGASNHTANEREENDYYATDPIAAELLLEIEEFPKDLQVWECAAGEGHLTNVFEKHGFEVRSSDLVDRGKGFEILNFLECQEEFNGSIITNPPYKYAKEFCEHALQIMKPGNKLAMFLKLQFLEGKERGIFFKKYPPKKVWVARRRIMCAKNGDFERMKRGGGSAVAYAWYIWESGYHGETVMDWFN